MYLKALKVNDGWLAVGSKFSRMKHSFSKLPGVLASSSPQWVPPQQLSSTRGSSLAQGSNPHPVTSDVAGMQRPGPNSILDNSKGPVQLQTSLWILLRPSLQVHHVLTSPSAQSVFLHSPHRCWSQQPSTVNSLHPHLYFRLFPNGSYLGNGIFYRNLGLQGVHKHGKEGWVCIYLSWLK